MSFASSTARRPFPFAKLAGIAVAMVVRAARALRPRGTGTSQLRALSDEQLRDAGIDRASIESTRPTQVVDGAVMRRLMSMR